MRIVIAVFVLLFAVSAADARTRQRVTVHPKRAPIADRMIYQHPYAVDYVLRSILCAFHVFSMGPDAKRSQLGSCVDHLRIPVQHRVV